MECREVQERLSEFHDGTLPPDEAGAVAVHIRDCGECAGTSRSLAAVREGLRNLPRLTAPPELLGRIRDAVDRETGGESPGSPGPAGSLRGKSVLSRLRVPMEAAAAVLLVASIWWYQKGAAPPPVPAAPSSPAGAAAPALPKGPDAASRQPPDAASPPGKEPRPARKTAGTPSPAARPAETPPATAAAAGKGEVASLPAGTPEPKPRAWSAADLPAAPALRASSESARIVPGGVGPPAAAGTPVGSAAGSPRDDARAPSPFVLAAPPSRLLRPLPYGREIVLDVAAEGSASAGERVAAAARRLGGSVERVERDPSGVDVSAVRVLLPEPAAPAFLSELDRIGSVPPEGKPAEADIPAGPTRGTVAYTVRIRAR